MQLLNIANHQRDIERLRKQFLKTSMIQNFSVYEMSQSKSLSSAVLYWYTYKAKLIYVLICYLFQSYSEPQETAVKPLRVNKVYLLFCLYSNFSPISVQPCYAS